jgi:hypothetical protein
VSERENTLLQSTFGSLEQSQSKPQFIYNLDRVSRIYEMITNPPPGVTSEQLIATVEAIAGAEIPAMSSVQEAMKLPPGTQFFDPNGELRTRP